MYHLRIVSWSAGMMKLLSVSYSVLVKLVIVFCEVIVSNAQADEDLENVVPHFRNVLL